MCDGFGYLAVSLNSCTVVPIIPASELIINPDGSIYHLALQPEQIADTIITVGDPERVARISRHFDVIEHQVSKREFVTHTGRIGQKRLTVIATGIGTDNIDIVFNELDALANIDLDTRTIKPTHTALTFIRVGTSGGLQPDIPVDSLLASNGSVGLEGLLHYYGWEWPAEVADLEAAVDQFFQEKVDLPFAHYFAPADAGLVQHFSQGMQQGITITCSGFYGPQGRVLRLPSRLNEQLFTQLQSFRHEHFRFTNFEMETSGIYGLAALLGHRAISLNAILANRPNGTFSAQPKKAVDELIEKTLEGVLLL